MVFVIHGVHRDPGSIPSIEKREKREEGKKGRRGGRDRGKERQFLVVTSRHEFVGRKWGGREGRGRQPGRLVL